MLVVWRLLDVREIVLDEVGPKLSFEGEKGSDEAEERRYPEQIFGLTGSIKVKWNMALNMGKHPPRQVLRTFILPNNCPELSNSQYLSQP